MLAKSEFERNGFDGLPGGDLVAAGLRDLRKGTQTEAALLVLSAGPRLRRLGIEVPARNEIKRPCEHRLYELLESAYGDGAFSRYNALFRRIVSFARALEHELSRQLVVRERR